MNCCWRSPNHRYVIVNVYDYRSNKHNFIPCVQNVSIKFEDNEEEFLPESDGETEKETKPKLNVELDALVELIKMEPDISTDEKPKKKKSGKRKKTVDENDNAVPQLKKTKKIKTEPV